MMHTYFITILALLSFFGNLEGINEWKGELNVTFSADEKFNNTQNDIYAKNNNDKPLYVYIFLDQTHKNTNNVRANFEADTEYLVQPGKTQLLGTIFKIDPNKDAQWFVVHRVGEKPFITLWKGSGRFIGKQNFNAELGVNFYSESQSDQNNTVVQQNLFAQNTKDHPLYISLWMNEQNPANMNTIAKIIDYEFEIEVNGGETKNLGFLEPKEKNKDWNWQLRYSIYDDLFE